MKQLMIVGTMSNVGKTVLTAGLCRVFSQMGFHVCPFKAQNMTSRVERLADGRLMNTAQMLQAKAACISPDARMNPVLLVPSSDRNSRVCINGEETGFLQAADFHAHKERIRETVLDTYRALSAQYDMMIIEGAGSPVELNLKEQDVVNMGFAQAVGAPVLLAGDIDPGGIFAQMYGTLSLLEKEERALVKGLIVNKFRGEPSLFTQGVRMLEERCGCPVLGVVPYMTLCLPGEDSLSDNTIDWDEETVEAQLDVLAETLRAHLPMDKILRIMEEGEDSH